MMRMCSLRLIELLIYFFIIYKLNGSFWCLPAEIGTLLTGYRSFQLYSTKTRNPNYILKIRLLNSGQTKKMAKNTKIVEVVEP